MHPPLPHLIPLCPQLHLLCSPQPRAAAHSLSLFLPTASTVDTSTSPSSTTSRSAWPFTPFSSSTLPPWTCCARLSRSSSSSPSRLSSSSPSGKVGPTTDAQCFSSHSPTWLRDAGAELIPLPSPAQGRCWQSWRNVGRSLKFRSSMGRRWELGQWLLATRTSSSALKCSLLPLPCAMHSPARCTGRRKKTQQVTLTSSFLQ